MKGIERPRLHCDNTGTICDLVAPLLLVLRRSMRKANLSG